MKRSLAWLAWRLPVIWVAGGEPAAVTAEAVPQVPAAPPVTVIHYHGGTHLHLEAPPGAAEVIRAALSNPHHDADLPELEP